ncbi:MAG: response regulator [Candidatus Scalindua sp.]|nr:response regulator [Candidatus Scalindua sp.]
MKKKKSKPEKTDQLRKKAEKMLNSDTALIENMSDEEVRKLAYELQVHQIELEMQNDELRKSQQALEESRDEYTDLYDFAPVGYVTVGEGKLILEANLRLASMLGRERGFLIKKPLSRFMIRESADKYYLCWRSALETKKHGTCEVAMVKKDDTTFYAQLECAFVPEEDGNPERCRITISDITERKEMEEALLQSEKLKSLGVITAGVAHEFNNLLAVILGTAELLDSGFEDDQDLKNGLNDIIVAGQNGAGIVKDMLSYVKSQEEDISNYAPYDIRCLLEEAINFTRHRLESMAQAKRVGYQIDREDMREIPEILCSHAELLGVFINIINNALDAMPDGGRLSFSTSSNDDTVFISISDTGIGMSENVKKCIFDPFFTTRRPEGTGLGMSMSYGTIARHGGKIEVESEKGNGATFNLSIPIRKDAAQKVVPPEYDRRVTRSKLNILVVDDNEDVCEIMDEVLTRCGHAVTSVDNGAEAIELAVEKDFDLVLCDLLMPEVHGYDVVKALNKLDKIPKIGLMTGWAELKSIDEEGYKIDFILEKPFKHAELAKHIDELDISS